jgi:AraC-like DNA-binding protein
MEKKTKYDEMHSRRLYIPDVCKFLQHDKSQAHIIKGALLCICRSGSATIRINYTDHNLNANDVLIILPTHMFSIEHTSSDFIGEALVYTDDYWTSVSRSINYKMLKKTEHYPLISIPSDKQTELYFLLNMIREHENNEDSDNDIEQSIIGGLAYSLLMMIASLIDKIDTELPRIVSRKEELTRGFFDLLSEHFETERQVSFYASKLCVTPKHLSMCIKEVTKLPILDWVNNVAILNIKHRLRNTNDTIQQISEDLNFQTASTFIRYFRQHTGITPLKFRNSDN